MEISLVSVPSAPTVGIGRSLENDSVKTMTQTPVPAIALGYPERGEFAFESDQFSIVAAAQGIASGRGLRGREAEVNQELEAATVGEHKVFLCRKQMAGVNAPMSLAPPLQAAT